MAQELKIKHTIDVHAEVIWIDEISGAYVASFNEDGWGDPNAELSESCLMIYAERVIDDADNHVVKIITSQFIYDNTALNTENKQFQLTYDEDGHYNVTLLRIPVSTDGENFVEGGAISQGDYVYHGNTLKVHDGSGLVAFSDYSSLVGDENVLQSTCEIIMLAKAKRKLSDLYNDFVENRKKYTEDLDPYIEKYNKLDADIQGAIRQFYQGMKTSARKTIEYIHETY